MQWLSFCLLNLNTSTIQDSDIILIHNANLIFQSNLSYLYNFHHELANEKPIINNTTVPFTIFSTYHSSYSSHFC